MEVCAGKVCQKWWRKTELPRRKAVRNKIAFANHTARLKGKGTTEHFDRKEKIEKRVVKKISLPNSISAYDKGDPFFFSQAIYEAQEKERKKLNGRKCRVCGKKLKGIEWYFCKEHAIAATGLATTSRTDGAYNEASEGGRVFGGQGRE